MRSPSGRIRLITFAERLSLGLRRVPARPIIEVRELLLANSLDVPVHALSDHALAGGDVREVGSALVEARLRAVPLDFARACALDLARDKTNHAERPVNVVRQSAEPREVLFDPAGPMTFQKPGRFTWHPWLRASVKVNLSTYIGGSQREMIDIRLKLALRVLYDSVLDEDAADRTLALWLRNPERIEALCAGTRFTIVTMDRVNHDVAENAGPK
jgi:uncharacterized protein YqfA (UPF0365 family)